MGEAAFPLFLGIFSALTLAVVNTAVKAGGDILSGRAILSSSAALLMAPFAFFVPLPDQATWAALAVSLPAHWLYQTALVRAMHRGDLSLVFPVMRGLAPLLTGLGAWWVLGEALSGLALLGLCLAGLAVMSFGWPAKGVALHKHPSAAALFWAGMTAVGVAVYTITDARGVRIAPNPFTFIVWLFLLDWIWLTTAAVVVRRRALLATPRKIWIAGLVAGAGSILSFGAALWALDMLAAAKVSALRETAVVFAALLGWVFLKEPFGLRRTIAAAILAGGLMLLQLTS